MGWTKIAENIIRIKGMLNYEMYHSTDWMMYVYSSVYIPCNKINVECKHSALYIPSGYELQFIHISLFRRCHLPYSLLRLMLHHLCGLQANNAGVLHLTCFLRVLKLASPGEQMDGCMGQQTNRHEEKWLLEIPLHVGSGSKNKYNAMST